MTFKQLRQYNLAFVNLGGIIKYCLRVFSLPETLKMLKRNKALIDCRTRDTLYICGLGPSLADVDLDKLGEMDIDTLVVNYFIKMSETTNLQPTYYLMGDEGFVRPKHRPALDLAVKLYPKAKFIWKSSFPRLDSSLKEYPCDKYYMAMYKGFYNSAKNIDITKITPAFGNVVCIAIAFGISLGYKKIVLLGADFNSFAFPNEVHCYDGGKATKKARRLALAQELFSYSFDAAVHENLAAYAKEKGIEIINATRGSLIDAYKRVDIPELYKV